jgi:hypothetical protein
MAKEKPPLSHPDFLIIGAPEAGGDIVKDALLKNPKVWFPPLDNILAFHSSFQIERLQIARDFLRGDIPYKSTHLFWLLRYFLQPVPTIKWVSKLFTTKQKDLIKGEFSDEYITLPFDEVEKLHRLLPDLKIIILIRHPVDRSYAAIKKKFEHNKKTPFASLNKRQLVALINSDWVRSHSSYQKALDAWPVFFGLKNIFVGFYDDLLEDPKTFMKKVSNFLELEPVSMTGIKVPPKASRKKFPPGLLPYLHPFYRQEIENLANRVNGQAGDWLDEFDAALAAKPAVK